MGIRQMAQPLGVGLAALTMPGLAAGHGVGAALDPGGVAAVWRLAWVLVVRSAETAAGEAAPRDAENPYRGSSVLWRIHAVSVLLVVPQFVVWTYGLVWLISERGWSPGAAGVLITVSQLLGAAGRMGAGAGRTGCAAG